MTHIGVLWQQNTITVADEHLATAISRDAMAVLREKIVPAPSRGLRAVAAGVPGELHELGLKMTADLFEGAGWEVAYLGPNTPVDSLLAYMARWKPRLLLLSIGSVASLLATADVIAAVRAQAAHLGPVIVGVGGPGLLGGARTWERLGADFWAETAGQAVARANALAAGGPPGKE